MWDISGGIGIPTFWCQLLERDDGPALMPLPADGFGCHAEAGIALLRALTEAAQSRLTVIAGARDDTGEARYRSAIDTDELQAWRAFLAKRLYRRCFSKVESHRFDRFDDELRWLLDRLRAVGIEQAIVVDLSPASPAPYAVVRVIVPGLEGFRHGQHAPGPRAQAQMGVGP